MDRVKIDVLVNHYSARGDKTEISDVFIINLACK